VSLCRAMGADIVIAVDLNWDLIGRRHRAEEEASSPQREEGGGVFASMLAKLQPGRRVGELPVGARDAPSLLEVLTTSLNIMQVRITQSRLAGEPADAMIRPRLAGIAAMDFHRAEVAIAEGERAVERALPLITEVLASHPPA